MRFATDKSARNLDALPGCNQVCVSHGAFMFKGTRGQGHGTQEQKYALNMMKDLHYDYALCTVRATNVAQRAIMEKNGWSTLDQFKSSYSDEYIILYGRPL